jgi:Flp pilus assembly protein TadD
MNVTVDDLVDMASRVLTELGPVTEEQLEDALADRGADPDDADVCMEELLDAGDDLLVTLLDDRWAWLPALLAGRVFTHRVTGSELEHDVLAVTPDLSPVIGVFDSEEYQHRLIDGAPVDYVFAQLDADTLTERGIPLELVDDGALLLPPGYLRERGCREGDVIALGVGQEGLRCEVVAAPLGPLTAFGERLEAVLALDPTPPVLLDMAIWTACADDPALFTEPLPPLAEAVDACGFSRADEWLGPRGFDVPHWQMAQQRAAIARLYNLDYDEAFAVLTLSALYHRAQDKAAATDDGHGDEAKSVARVMVAFLADPVVAEAVLAETIGPGRDGAEALVSFVETLEPLAPRTARPALLWLRGKAYERLGDVVRAETDYEAARAMDPQYPLALVELARYAGDRSDADRAIDLLRLAGASPQDSRIQVLSLFQAAPRPGIGRNDPCWCGSGRKYKKCHLHNERVPLEERALWLCCKAVTFVTADPWREVLIEAGRLRAQYEDDPGSLAGRMTDPLVSDLVLFEGGAFAEFVATRGGLLPDDERRLAEQWLLIDRSVYEVEDAPTDADLTMRDVRTGDSYRVRDRTTCPLPRKGELVCARVVPVGDTMQVFGSIEPVALQDRDELIALLDSRPDHMRLIEFLTRRFAPAEISNSEGDPLVPHEATLYTADPMGFAAHTGSDAGQRQVHDL